MKEKNTNQDPNKGQGCLAWFVFIPAFAFGAFMIIWNANQATDVMQRLSSTADEATKIQFGTFDPSLEGQMVVVSGPAVTDNVFEDLSYGVRFPGITYKRALVKLVSEEGTKRGTDTRGREYRETYENYEWQFQGMTSPKAAEIGSSTYESSSVQTVADSEVRVGKYQIDPTLFDDEDLFTQPIYLESIIDLTDSEYYLIQDNRITDAVDIDYPQLGAKEVSFYGVPNEANITVLGLQKDSSIVAPTDGRISGAITGYRSAADIIEYKGNIYRETDDSFNMVGLFFIFVSTLPLRFLLRSKLSALTNQKLPSLRFHILISMVVLTFVIFWFLNAVGMFAYRNEYLEGLVKLLKAAGLGLVFLLLVRKQFPAFLFKEKA